MTLSGQPDSQTAQRPRTSRRWRPYCRHSRAQHSSSQQAVLLQPSPPKPPPPCSLTQLTSARLTSAACAAAAPAAATAAVTATTRGPSLAAAPSKSQHLRRAPEPGVHPVTVRRKALVGGRLALPPKCIPQHLQQRTPTQPVSAKCHTGSVLVWHGSLARGCWGKAGPWVSSGAALMAGIGMYTQRALLLPTGHPPGEEARTPCLPHTAPSSMPAQLAAAA